MVVDAVIRHWVTLVTGGEAGPEGFGRAVQWLAAFFSAEYGILSYPHTSQLQVYLHFLMGLTGWLGPRMNVTKTVGMVCQPCPVAGGHSEVAYDW